MQTVEVVWPYTSNRLLPTKVGVTHALGGGVNEQNVHAGTMYSDYNRLYNT